MDETNKINLIEVFQICEIIGFLEATELPSARQYAKFLRELIGKSSWAQYLWDGAYTTNV